MSLDSNNGSVYYELQCNVQSDSGLSKISNNGSKYYNLSANDFILWGQSTRYIHPSSNNSLNYYFYECDRASDVGLILTANNNTKFYYNSAFNCVSFCERTTLFLGGSAADIYGGWYLDEGLTIAAERLPTFEDIVDFGGASRTITGEISCYKLILSQPTKIWTLAGNIKTIKGINITGDFVQYIGNSTYGGFTVTGNNAHIQTAVHNVAIGSSWQESHFYQSSEINLTNFTGDVYLHGNSHMHSNCSCENLYMLDDSYSEAEVWSNCYLNSSSCVLSGNVYGTVHINALNPTISSAEINGIQVNFEGAGVSVANVGAVYLFASGSYYSGNSNATIYCGVPNTFLSAGASCLNLYCDVNNTYSEEGSTISGTARYYSNSVHGGTAANAIFYDTSVNNGTITGYGEFHGNPNTRTIAGSASFYYPSYNSSTGVVGSNSNFFENTYNEGQVTGPVNFAGTYSRNLGLVVGDADFSGLNSENESLNGVIKGTVTGDSYAHENSGKTGSRDIGGIVNGTRRSAASLSYHVSNMVDSRINNSMTIPTNATLFSVNDGNTYVRNTNLWCADLRLNCVSPWNNFMEYTTWGAGTLITPRHLIMAAHLGYSNRYPPKIANNTIRFVSNNGTKYDRNIVATTGALANPSVPPGYQRDVEICTLNADLPSDIFPCKIPPSDLNDYLQNLAITRPGAFGLDQEKKALIRDLNEFHIGDTTTRFTSPTNTNRLTLYENLIGGDSGNPAFLIINDELVIVTAWYGGNGGSGPSLHLYETAINNAIVNMDISVGNTGPVANPLWPNSGGHYKVNVVNLSAFRKI
jgi:hypothetical protein